MRQLNEKGMTLIEIMIVIAIVAGLMAVLATNVMSSYNKAKYHQGEIQLRNIVTAIQKYQLDCNRSPSAELGLNALVEAPADCHNWGPEPYLSKKQLKDPYGHSFVYEVEGEAGIVTYLGADGRLGGTGYNRDTSSKDLDDESH